MAYKEKPESNAVSVQFDVVGEASPVMETEMVSALRDWGNAEIVNTEGKKTNSGNINTIIDTYDRLGNLETLLHQVKREIEAIREDIDTRLDELERSDDNGLREKLKELLLSSGT